jgi:hypothetical protein
MCVLNEELQQRLWVSIAVAIDIAADERCA